MELVEDLTKLSDINGDIILHQLKGRFEQDRIYTLVGDVLVAMNPYKQLDIYSSEYYKENLSNTAHVYSVSSLAYRELTGTDRDQCFVISGESGTGKTETCKYIIRHLTELSTGDRGLEKRIMQTNPLLEAFGNAKTIMNNNSSRFGKYLQLKFVEGRMIGAKVNEYLLEKSRVVKQGEGETNFHIFYWLLDGLDHQTLVKLHLSGCGQFKYMNNSDKSSVDDNIKMFQQLRVCFDLVGFREDEQYSILVCLAAILHIGNIDIQESDHGFAIIDINNPSVISAATHLGIDCESLVQLLTVAISLTKFETIRKHHSKTKAEASRDAIAKATYDRLFRWVVNQINRLLAPPINYVYQLNEIGILDIFGFENFKLNGFEQLCINLANERLHQFFTEHIFQQELTEYYHEGVKGLHIMLTDNTPLLNSFLSGTGCIFSILDEQHSIPGANDIGFLRKINTLLKKEQFYIAPKSVSQGQFTVHHYAGEVKYSVNEFLDKNMDQLPSGATGVLQCSNNQLISLLFRASISSTGTLCMNRSTINKISSSSIHKNRGRKGTKPQSNTISSQFKHSLTSLVAKMTVAVPHFIRCIKPNNNKAPEIFDDKCVERQLLYTGITETVRIRKDGFGYRPTFIEFNDRFGIDSNWNIEDDIKCQLTLADCGINPDEYMIGQTKLFLKHYHLTILLQYIMTKTQSAILIQSIVRRYIQRCKYSRLLEKKANEERIVANLCTEINESLNNTMECLMRIGEEDEERLLEEKRKSDFLLFKERVTSLPPPSDLYQLPPTPIFESDDEQDNNDIINEEQSLLRSFELLDSTTNKNMKRLSYQSQVLQSSMSVSFSWLYGMLSKKKAELLMKGYNTGTFIIRVNRKNLSYILSYRSSNNSYKHINITQLPNMKYLLSGESTSHASLEELVQYHIENIIESTGERLSCGYYEDDEDIAINIGDNYLSI